MYICRYQYNHFMMRIAAANRHHVWFLCYCCYTWIQHTSSDCVWQANKILSLPFVLIQHICTYKIYTYNMCYIYKYACWCIRKLLHGCIWYRILSNSCHTSVIRDAPLPSKSIQMYSPYMRMCMCVVCVVSISTQLVGEEFLQSLFGVSWLYALVVAALLLYLL